MSLSEITDEAILALAPIKGSVGLYGLNDHDLAGMQRQMPDCILSNHDENEDD